ncbi:MAG TPA: GtrA family protein [Acidimicrobiia bacterium]|nr:GtrA family protein [Acidimicrobiia bacterium]
MQREETVARGRSTARSGRQPRTAPPPGVRRESARRAASVRRPWSLCAWAWRTYAAKIWRYGAVSIIATSVSLTILGVLVGVFDAPPAWSNVIATLIATIPSFELNRRWVWRKQGRRSVAAEIVPYVALTVAGLVLSTASVHFVGEWTNHWSRLGHTIAVECANLAAFGSLWVIQFVLLELVLFRHHGDQPA